MKKDSSRQGALGAAGNAMMNIPDSSRNNNQAVTTGAAREGNLVMVNPNTISRTQSN